MRAAEEALEADGLVNRVKQAARRRPDAEFLRVTQRSKIPPLGEADEEFLDSLAAQIKYVDGDSLTKIAKSTVPFQLTKPEHLVDLDGYLEALKKKHDRFVRSPKVAKLVAQAKAE